MGMPEICRQRKHVRADLVTGAGTGLQRAGGKPVTEIMNARSAGAIR
jgi:hypothetical protein